jgi:hypothetical protein
VPTGSLDELNRTWPLVGLRRTVEVPVWLLGVVAVAALTVGANESLDRGILDQLLGGRGRR